MIVGRPFFITYAALTAVTVLLVAMPPLVIVVGILTLGIGVLIPSIWLYVTAMMPGLLLYRRGVHWSLAALVSIGAASALAIIPARIAAPRAERTLIELTSGDFRKPLPRRPEQIELIRDQVAFVHKGDDPIEHAACDEICQHLLLTRQVTTVAVIAHARHGEPNVVVSYSLTAMARCPTAFDSRHTRVLRSTTKAKIAGICIMPSRGVGMMDGISISQREVANRSIPTFSLTTVQRARRVEVSERRQGKDVPLLRATEVEIGSATAPFLIFPYAGLLTTVSGTGISKSDRAVNQQPLLALMDELGFSLVPEGKRRPNIPVQAMVFFADDPLQPDRDMVLSILAQPGADRFDYDLEAAVNQWTERFWSGAVDLDRDDRSALSAVTLDRRMSRIGGLNVLWRGRPDLVALLAEPILTRLAWPVSAPNYDQDRQLAMLVARQDDAFLADHSAAVLAVVRDHLSRNTSPLLVAAVGLGAEGTPAVLAGMVSDDNIVRIDAIGAACRSPMEVAPYILPAISTMCPGKAKRPAT
ncbi:MAG: hypothetical protein EOS12_20750 [Mesorhizobium sp.]|uniref:hypothetical protein n=1 Tax=Mesorhizobium sp. TaxID=1871066 RepID=UPI000FE6F51C|nr:hypothetical protein [Mesorhizobium sp.]RWN33243.1 MAG: hypothetical protein EOR97_09800 [Mesorhizobium sp.]RWO42389.1 MAG: hypothetical protein EOS12_20750 [Mesorhizobium sp.]